MKIIYCIAGTYNSGGMERVLANKANYLIKCGHEVMIITSDQNGRQPYFTFDPRIRHLDLGLNYKERSGKGLVSTIFSYIKLQVIHRKRLSKVLRQRKSDVVISLFDHDASFLHRIKDGSKKILEIHFSRFKRIQYGRKGIWGWIDKWRSRHDLRIAKRYDRFVVLTQEDRAYWGNWSSIRVIPNANSFHPAVSATLKDKRVIAVGRLDYQKAFEELIYAWDMVFKAHPDWSLAIFGEGPEKGALRALIEQLGLQAVVHLRAPVKAIHEEYVNSSVLALTSRYEGLPMAMLEGQACGLPMVAYACKCGPRDIIHHGENGFLVSLGDQEELARRLIQLIDDNELRKQMGQNSRMFSSTYSEEKIMNQWINLFEEVTDDNFKINQ